MESDEEFALLADAVEEAVSKRRKMANSFSGPPHKQPETEEGQYTAALRGSKSQLWQVLNNKKRPFENASSTGRQGFYNSYKGPATAFADTEEEQQMQCPSCRTPCVVLVSKSERNPGRKFYKCTEDNGGCGFFQWCDSSSQMQHAPAKNFNADALGFEASLDCPCGAGLCVVLTAKTQKNMGRQFFRCPLPQGQGCDFFKWCDSVSSPSPRTADVPSPNSKSSAFNSPKSGCFPCFKCGMEGHWARDCPSASASQGIKNASQSQNTCFKCGQAGHWARDCPAEKLNASFSHRSGTR